MIQGLVQQNCVVLGAGGFLGTNLCAYLQGRVRSLRAFGRSRQFAAAATSAEWVVGDLFDERAVSGVIEGADTVFHLASASTAASANADMIADLEKNVFPTLKLLENCRRAGVKRIIFVSSGGTVYGLDAPIPTPECAPTAPITAYGVTKLAIENYLRVYEHLHQLDYRVLRVANPFGPYQLALKNQGVIGAFLWKAFHGEPLQIWGDGSVQRDYIYIDDVSRALAAAAVHEGGERTFNVGSGEGRSLNSVLEAIETVLGRKLPVERHHGRPTDVPVSVLDCTLARDVLGWTPAVGFHEGIQKTAEWLTAWMAERPVAECHQVSAR